MELIESYIKYRIGEDIPAPNGILKTIIKLCWEFEEKYDPPTGEQTIGQFLNVLYYTVEEIPTWDRIIAIFEYCGFTAALCSSRGQFDLVIGIKILSKEFIRHWLQYTPDFQ